MDQLILKRAAASRLSGEWSEDDYDVLCEGAVVGRIMIAAAAPVGTPWLWTLAYGHHEDRTPIYGYGATREAAMAAFARKLAAGIGPPCHWRAAGAFDRLWGYRTRGARRAGGLYGGPRALDA